MRFDGIHMESLSKQQAVMSQRVGTVIDPEGNKVLIQPWLKCLDRQI